MDVTVSVILVTFFHYIAAKIQNGRELVKKPRCASIKKIIFQFAFLITFRIFNCDTRHSFFYHPILRERREDTI
jgi:hypothetical protein